MRDKKITIKDIAQEASVSETTVSRYINGKFEYMSIDTKNKVKRVIEDLNYRPSNIARSLKSNKTKLLGAIIADIENPFSNLIIKGLIDRANELGYSLMVSISNNLVDKENEGINRFLDNNVDGLIVNTVTNNEEILKEVSNELPMVLIDRDVKILDSDIVSSNNYDLGVQLMIHVLEKKFNTIAYFSEVIKDNSVRMLRHQSFLDSLKNKEVNTIKTYIIDRNKPNDILDKLRNFFSFPGPRVIVASNGLVQISLLKILKTENYSLGKDFYFCGFDDWEWASLIGNNGITTVGQDSYHLGTEAINTLYKRISVSDNKNKKESIEVKGSLNIRGSTLID